MHLNQLSPEGRGGRVEARRRPVVRPSVRPLPLSPAKRIFHCRTKRKKFEAQRLFCSECPGLIVPTVTGTQTTPSHPLDSRAGQPSILDVRAVLNSQSASSSSPQSAAVTPSRSRGQLMLFGRSSSASTRYSVFSLQNKTRRPAHAHGDYLLQLRLCRHPLLERG